MQTLATEPSPKKKISMLQLSKTGVVVVPTCLKRNRWTTFLATSTAWTATWERTFSLVGGMNHFQDHRRARKQTSTRHLRLSKWRSVDFDRS